MGISTLSFLSFDKKCCMHFCNVSYQSWKKTKCLFLPSECMNDFGLKDKVASLKKLVFQSGVGFFIWSNLDLSQPFYSQLLPVDFWRIALGKFLFLGDLALFYHKDWYFSQLFLFHFSFVISGVFSRCETYQNIAWVLSKTSLMLKSCTNYS